MLEQLKIFFGFQDNTSEESESSNETQSSIPNISPQKPIIKSFNGKLINGKQKTGIDEVRIEEPKIYEDSLNIATHLREKKPVIVNLHHLDSQTGKRLIDFICGTAYAINGHMMKIGENIFLFTPENVLISEDKSNTLQSQYNNESPFNLNHAVAGS